MTDGNIQAARKQLGAAVDRLCQPHPAIYQHRMRYSPSLYNQLRDDLAGTQGDHKTHAKSQPPIWIDACQLLAEIDKQTRRWSPRNRGGDTESRLNHLADQTWRPQDTDRITDITNQIQRWCDTITNLLDPQSVKTIAAACPSCGRHTIQRRDSAGETVRQPALRVIADQGCTCQACKAHWAPDRYLFLCRLLGFDLPEGVLE
jgi:predicted RNA-binding Zn-ribbon protein involved in translation (DUF1610 family)